jgi:hypothetical protein
MKLGEFLLQEKIITQEQLQKALDYQKENPKALIGEVLVKLGLVDMRTLVGTLSKRKGQTGQSSSVSGQPKQRTAELSKIALRLGEVLFMDNVITERQLQKAIEYQQQYPGMMLGKALVNLGYATQRDVSNALLKMRRLS